MQRRQTVVIDLRHHIVHQIGAAGLAVTELRQLPTARW
jgi:hypothetical protein